MSEIDTLIGVVGTLVGAVLGASVAYYFKERKAKREIALRPMDDRKIALNDVFGVLTDCFFDMRSAILTPPKTQGDYDKRVVAPIQALEKAVYHRALWISTIWPKITTAMQIFAQTAVAIHIRLPGIPSQSLPPFEAFPIDVKAFEEAYFDAGNSIGKALGIPRLENELRDNLGITKISPPK